MDDLKNKLEKLIVDAAECDLIANLAMEEDKRQSFRDLAAQYRSMAATIRETIADRGQSHAYIPRARRLSSRPFC